VMNSKGLESFCWMMWMKIYGKNKTVFRFFGKQFFGFFS